MILGVGAEHVLVEPVPGGAEQAVQETSGRDPEAVGQDHPQHKRGEQEGGRAQQTPGRALDRVDVGGGGVDRGEEELVLDGVLRHRLFFGHPLRGHLLLQDPRPDRGEANRGEAPQIDGHPAAARAAPEEEATSERPSTQDRPVVDGDQRQLGQKKEKEETDDVAEVELDQHPQRGEGGGPGVGAAGVRSGDGAGRLGRGQAPGGGAVRAGGERALVPGAARPDAGQNRRAEFSEDRPQREGGQRGERGRGQGGEEVGERRRDDTVDPDGQRECEFRRSGDAEKREEEFEENLQEGVLMVEISGSDRVGVA
jgi:hypothetical protein